MARQVLTLNQISIKGLERLPRDCYEIASEFSHPDAILLRSHKLTGGGHCRFGAGHCPCRCRV